MTQRQRLREALLGDETVMVPGAYDAITAKIVEQTGFSAVYCTGAGTVNGLTGLPDLGLATLTEMVQNARWISEAVTIPVIADADTGYGNALNVMRTVREFEKAGVAGIHIEDQVIPKRCGHVPGKLLVPTEEMVGKLRAAVAARTDTAFVIIARTDARAVSGLDDAIARARAYVEAGADVIFPEALESREEFASFARMLPGVPLLANMTEFGRTPYLTRDEFHEMGYRLVIYPMTGFRVMMKAVGDAMAELKAKGHQQGLLDHMRTRSALYELIEYGRFEAYEREFAVGAARS